MFQTPVYQEVLECIGDIGNTFTPSDLKGAFDPYKKMFDKLSPQHYNIIVANTIPTVRHELLKVRDVDTSLFQKIALEHDIVIGDIIGAGSSGTVYAAAEKHDAGTSILQAKPLKFDCVIKIVNIDSEKTPEEKKLSQYTNSFSDELKITAVMSDNGISPQYVGGWVKQIKDDRYGFMVTKRYAASFNIVRYEKSDEVGSFTVTDDIVGLENGIYYTTKEKYDQYVDIIYKLLVKMHKVGYIHNDVRPFNVVFKIGNDGRIDETSFRMIDFGLTVKDTDLMRVHQMTSFYYLPQNTAKALKAFELKRVLEWLNMRW